MSHSTKIKFTKSSLTSLKKASNCNRYFVYDTVVRGFCLMVTQTGHKSFYLNRTINDRPVRIYIGPFPDIPVEMARKKAEEFAAQVALGNDPQSIISHRPHTNINCSGLGISVRARAQRYEFNITK